MAESNANSFTYDGIELGGERTANEIEKKLKELEADGHNITKISIVGYSLGGLVARYAIGLLYSNNVFDKMQPMVRIISSTVLYRHCSLLLRTSPPSHHPI